MSQNVTLMNASYSNVPAVLLPKTGGGTAKFTDTSPTTAVPADVASGKIFFDSDGNPQTGTASGGGGGSSKYTAKITTGLNSSNSVTYGGNTYHASGSSFNFSGGDSVNVKLNARSYCYVYVDSVLVAQSNVGVLDSNITLPSSNVNLVFSTPNATTSRLDITSDASTSTSITANGTHAVAGFEEAVVNVSGGSPNLQSKSIAFTPSQNTQTSDVSADNGYDGLSNVGITVNPIPSQYIVPTGNIPIIANSDSIDVSQYATASVNVPTGGGGLTLLKETSLGSLSTTSTSGTDTSKSLSLASSTGWSSYDMLLVDVSVDTQTNGRHTSTVSTIYITHQSSYGTPSNYAVGGNKWNSKLSSNGTASTRQSTTAYGIYANSVSVSSGTMSIPLYMKYNNNNTGTINGSYTARIYGLKLYDLIGG